MDHSGSVWQYVRLNIFSKSYPKIATEIFTITVDVYQNSPKATKYLSYFWDKICHQVISKIAHSDHSALDQAQSTSIKVAF